MKTFTNQTLGGKASPSVAYKLYNPKLCKPTTTDGPQEEGVVGVEATHLEREGLHIMAPEVKGAFEPALCLASDHGRETSF